MILAMDKSPDKEDEGQPSDVLADVIAAERLSNETAVIGICGCSALVVWKVEAASIYTYIGSSKLDFEDDRRPPMTTPSNELNAAMYTNTGCPRMSATIKTNGSS